MSDYDPDLPYDAETQRIKRERDADAIEVPEPYTKAEWAETEGAAPLRYQDDRDVGGGWDEGGPGDFRERALDAGYDPSDPKAISLEMWGEL